MSPKPASPAPTSHLCSIVNSPLDTSSLLYHRLLKVTILVHTPMLLISDQVIIPYQDITHFLSVTKS